VHLHVLCIHPAEVSDLMRASMECQTLLQEFAGAKRAAIGRPLWGIGYGAWRWRYYRRRLARLLES
jgi:hypothetical protein